MTGGSSSVDENSLHEFHLGFFCFITCIDSYRASLVAQMVKNLPVMQETGFRSLGWEDPLELL